jgi:hypothetical protein
MNENDIKTNRTIKSQRIFGTKHEHESYGLISFSRRQISPPQYMFGSQVRTGNPIAMTVKNAVVEHDDEKQWFFAKDLILEIEMTPAQFADAITSLNISDGVPCTIRYVRHEGKKQPPPYEGKIETHHKGIKQRVHNAMERAKNYQALASKILSKKGNLTIKERKELTGYMFHMMQEICENLPFIASELAKVMDETKSQAKAEIEAFLISTAKQDKQEPQINYVIPKNIEAITYLANQTMTNLNISNEEE